MSENQPHVLLIAIDTLRADHLSCYGYKVKTSPFIDKIASEGAIFEYAYAPAIPTHPGYTTMLTGVHPLHHKIVCHAGSIFLSKNIPLVSELLKRKSYITAAADNLAIMKGGEWFIRGYDYYFATGGIVVISKGIKISGEIVLKKTLEFLDMWSSKLKDKKFFLFVHFWDPHAPYYPPEDLVKKIFKGDPSQGDLKERVEKTVWGRHLLKGWLGKLIEKGSRNPDYIEALYDAEILYTDDKVKKIYEKLEELGILDDTIIIITADHGESMGEHNIFYDHHGLYEWDVRIPLIVRYPEKVPKGTKVKAFVQHTDIVPTILDVVSCSFGEHIYGKSLIRLIEGEWSGYDKVLLMENTRMTKRAIRTERWKLIETLRPDPYGRPAGYLELFDLEKDPLEQNNLAYEDRDTALRLLGELEEAWRKLLKGTEDPLLTQEISLPIPE
ncbi:MAG: sulfatase [Thermoprotei archaeon]|nr:MAG: sulfatase [Thermoprotei archaeon]